MAFESLLGNEQLKQNLSAAVAKNRFSHFYLISGPQGSGKRTLANLLTQALMCQNDRKPCGTCSGCRKVAAGAHPDYITVCDPEKKTVPVDLVREARESMFIRPNEGAHKVYLFPQELRVEGQNALLKILEEPPAYGVFILLSDNPEKLLPTVRSRCTELKLLPVAKDVLRPFLEQKFPDASPEDITGAIYRGGGYVGQAMELLQNRVDQIPEVTALVKAYAARDPLAIATVLVPLERKPRDQVLPVFEAFKTALQEGLACRGGMPPASRSAKLLSAERNAKDLMAAHRQLEKAIEYAQGNVSVAAICGWLTQTLR